MKEDKTKPKFMITYLCKQCNSDFARTEKEKPKCFYCNSKKEFIIVSKKKITPKLIAKRLKKTTDRMLENLQKAWRVRPKDGSKKAEESEDKLLEVLVKAKGLKKNTHKIANKIIRKNSD